MLTEAHGRREQRAVRHEAREQPAHHPLTERTRDFFLGDLAADLDQPAVLHAGRAGRFAVAAGEAAIQVDLGAARDRRAFHHLLDQIDAPARAIEFVAEYLVGRAGRRAETAMHAIAQNGVGLVAIGRVANEVREVGLHRVAQKSG